ncbi:hypothetical protein NPIL_132401 [Nephila pilipes]|uniref:Uncharacterized protein n=1 Tax=Nephila pilipes TaxID=299642 RepID=A0A8X6PA93_NEPPI|nr:hypothetical protein NPIL_132401 [Nephila pilipes]
MIALARAGFGVNPISKKKDREDKIYDSPTTASLEYSTLCKISSSRGYQRTYLSEQSNVASDLLMDRATTSDLRIRNSSRLLESVTTSAAPPTVSTITIMTPHRIFLTSQQGREKK